MPTKFWPFAELYWDVRGESEERVRDGWRVVEAKDIEVMKCGRKERMLMLLQ